MYGFDEMTHIGMKRKLFGCFSDYFRLLGAKFYCKHHDPHVIGLKQKLFGYFSDYFRVVSE